MEENVVLTKEEKAEFEKKISEVLKAAAEVLSPEKKKQITAKVLRRRRHPRRTCSLRDYLDMDNLNVIVEDRVSEEEMSNLKKVCQAFAKRLNFSDIDLTFLNAPDELAFSHPDECGLPNQFFNRNVLLISRSEPCLSWFERVCIIPRRENDKIVPRYISVQPEILSPDQSHSCPGPHSTVFAYPSFSKIAGFKGVVILADKDYAPNAEDFDLLTEHFEKKRHNKTISNMIYGVAAGDAMGFPLQFFKREQVKDFNITTMIAHKNGKYPAGTWSDDTSLTLALADSLSRTEEIDYNEIMKNFYDWMSKGCFTPAGKAFDVGRTCFKAILNYSDGKAPLECGGQGENENGNGSLMRISPLVFYIQKIFGDSAFDKKETFEVIHNVSSLTHAHPIALVGCDIYLAFLFALLKGHDKSSALDFAFESTASFVKSNPEFEYAFSKYERLTSKTFIRLPEDEISSSGYVVDTLEAAFWSFITTDSYRACILKAVNLGKDTDTIAAVSGAMAALYYGWSCEEVIPSEWKKALQKRELIDRIIKKFQERY